MQIIFLFILIVGIHPTVMHKPNPLDTREPDYTIVLGLVKKLHSLPLIIHYDNRSHNSDLLSGLNNEVRSQYVWNYDIQTNFHRTDIRYIHIVDLSNLDDFEKYLSSNENVHYWDTIIFLVRQKSVPEKILNKLALTSGIFVVTLANSKLFSCSHIILSVFKCILRETKIEEASSKPFFEDFTMRGITFRVGYLTNAPYVYQRLNSNGILKIIGSEISLLKLLSKITGFRYKLVGVNQYNGSKYSTMLENLERRSVSWAIGGINQNFDRTRKYDFMRYINLEGMTAMFYRFEDTLPLITLSKSLSFQKTSLLVFLCMISLFLMALIANKWFENTRNDKILYILIIAAPLIEQAYPMRRMFRKNPVKFVLLLWCFSCYLITVIYKSYLVTSFISSSQKSMTILNLINDGYRFEEFKIDSEAKRDTSSDFYLDIELKLPMELSSEDDYWYIKESCANSLECIGVKKRYYFGNLCESSSKMKSEKLALIGEKHTLNFKVLSNCDKLSAADKFKVRFADDNIIGAEWQTWAMRKHSMLTLPFSKIVSRMDAAGILDMWSRNEINPNYITRENMGRSTENGCSPLDLKILTTPFTVLMVGFLISSLVFLTEILIKRNRK